MPSSSGYNKMNEVNKTKKFGNGLESRQSSLGMPGTKQVDKKLVIEMMSKRAMNSQVNDMKAHQWDYSTGNFKQVG